MRSSCLPVPSPSICLLMPRFQSSWWEMVRVLLLSVASGNNGCSTSTTNVSRIPHLGQYIDVDGGVRSPCFSAAGILNMTTYFAMKLRRRFTASQYLPWQKPSPGSKENQRYQTHDSDEVFYIKVTEILSGMRDFFRVI